MSNTHEPPWWKEHLLAALGAPHTHENIRLLTAWARAEGGTAKWNPLNTTFDLPGATLYNQNPGVKNYTRPAWGVCATALTLTSPASGPLRFGKILGHLQAATYTAEQIVDDCADQFSTWGTDVALLREVLAEV